MPTPALSLGFSPCPNDTFIFHALVSGAVPTAGFTFAPEVLADVETLNHWALAGRLDVTKLSFHALGLVLDEYVLLGAGAALGRGCGPLLVSLPGLEPAKLGDQTVAVPGHYTTAALLLRLAYPECQSVVAMPFDQIMPALARGEVGAGVIIHEGRFTYRRHGLQLVRDLGRWWEETTGQPIPLGGIAARRSLGQERLLAVEGAIRASLELARREPDRSRDYIRAQAQELEEEVIAQHIALYVNDFSLDLGAAGREAVAEFMKGGERLGIFPAGSGERFSLVA